MKKKIALMLALCMSVELAVTNVSAFATEAENNAATEVKMEAMAETTTEIAVNRTAENATEAAVAAEAGRKAEVEPARTEQETEWADESEITCQPETATTTEDDFVIDENGVLRSYSGAGGEVTIPNTVTGIGDSAFSNCSSLTSITIPDSVTSIGNFAFYLCGSLTSIIIPNSVTSIGAQVFSDCSSLTSITVEEGNTMYDSRDNCNAIIDKNTNTLLYGCSATIIPSSVTSIGDRAFSGRTSLTSITIPEGVMSIGDYAFEGCTSLTSITIPDSVTSVGMEIFDKCQGLADQYGFVIVQNVLYSYCDDYEAQKTIPDNVIKIEAGAFYYNQTIQSITIPDSVKSIGDSAFSHCSGLTSITIPDSVTNMGADVFSNCKGMADQDGFVIVRDALYNYYGEATQVTIPDQITKIETGVFADCTALESIYVPDGVTSIGNEAFSNCTALQSITIPDKVTSIGDRAFYSCESLTGITIPGSVMTIGEDAFGGCRNVTDLEISQGVTSIGDYAFQGCRNLTNITIPASVTSVGHCAFSSSSKLESIEVQEGNTAYESPGGCNALIEKKTNTLLLGCGTTTIPEGVTSIGDKAFDVCTSLESITIPDSVTSIGKEAFGSCGIKSIILPESVQSIGEFAFISCQELKSIVVPASVTSIGSEAFVGCDSLQGIWGETGSQAETYATKYNISFFVYGETPLPVVDIKDFVIVDGVLTKYNGLGGEVIVPDGVSKIGNEAFLDCTEVISVQMPDGLTSIGDWAFNGCTKLASVGMPDGVTDIGTHAFDGCAALETIKIPESVKNIGEWAFYRCSKLTNLTIPEGVMSIGSWAFVNCVNLTSFHLPASVSYLGQEIFSGCDSLTSISVQAGNAVYDSRKQCNGIVENAENKLIAGCSSTVIVDGVTSIGDYAFSGVSNLKSIVIPDGVKSIGGYAFSNCTGLSSVTIPNSVTSIGDKAFWGCTNLTSITIPGSVTSIGKEAFDTGYLKEIRGYAGTYAYKYATQNGITFQAIVIELLPGDIAVDETKDSDKGKEPVVENTTETRKDGSVVTTEKTTYSEGNVSMTIIATSKDTKKQTRVDMEIDADKNLKSADIEVSKKTDKKKMSINLKELKSMVTQIKGCNVQYIHPLADSADEAEAIADNALDSILPAKASEDMSNVLADAYKQEDSFGKAHDVWADALYVTAKKANISIRVSAKDNQGRNKYSVSIQEKDLSQKKFVVYRSDNKGNPVMENQKKNYVTVSPKKDLTIQVAGKGNYQLQNKKDAAKTNQKIMKTVTPTKSSVTVKPGSSTKFALSSKCNKSNIQKITYQSAGSNVNVSKTGKISAKTSGTTKVTANVTMKNGSKKSISMKVSVS